MAVMTARATAYTVHWKLEKGRAHIKLLARDILGKRLLREACCDLPKALPIIRLTHGQALWAMSELGFRGSASEPTFHEYIKSLRKLGVPFERRRIGHQRGEQAIYTYDHLMELSLTLTLRVYHVVPDSLLERVIHFRHRLYQHYRLAYAERCSGRGAPIIATAPGANTAIRLSGLFLDLRINFSGGNLVSFGPPRLVSPAQALSIFSQRDLAARALLPLNLSSIAEKLVASSLRAPVIRRGPRHPKRRH
jgi:hypothetical protein